MALSPPRLTSLFFFPQKRLILRIERQSQKRSGEEKGTISATIPPPPAPTKEAKNRQANTAYVLYSKFAWDVMVRENRILDQILLYEPFFTQLAWEWLKKRFTTLRNIGT